MRFERGIVADETPQEAMRWLLDAFVVVRQIVNDDDMTSNQKMRQIECLTDVILNLYNIPKDRKTA